MSDLRIERTELAADHAQALLMQLDRELLQAYPEEGATFFGLVSDEVAPGNGALLVAYVDREAAGCGAVRRISATEAEIKRMFVSPSHRSQGIAGALLRELEAVARSLSLSRAVLETGDRIPAAMALYRGAGYEVVPCFGDYASSPLSICMAKEL